MKPLTVNEINDAIDAPFEEIYISEWAGKVRVRAMTGHERNEFENLLERQDGRVKGSDNFRVKLCAMSIIGEDGKLLFGPSQVDALGKKSAVALDRIFAVALRLNVLSTEAREHLRKNSEGEPGEGSSST